MKKWRHILHWFIIIIFLVEIAYGMYMIFFVVGGSRWPLMARAIDTPMNVILKRRLYGIEAWLAIAGLSIYLGITEIIPWKFKKSDGSSNKQGAD